MNKRNLFLIVTCLVLVFLAVGTTWETAQAAPRERGETKKEAKLYYGNSYDLYLGNSGVYFANTYYNNMTAVLEKAEPYNRGWRYFVQGILTIDVVDENGVQADRFLGAVQVYFNLDTDLRHKWDDPDANMSIWYKDEWDEGSWVKCPSFLVKSKAAPRGRVVCYATDFGDYGLAWTWPTLKVKIAKALRVLDEEGPDDCMCSGNFYNCGDFETQDDAQVCYNHCITEEGWDVHDIDSDGDGTACEE